MTNQFYVGASIVLGAAYAYSTGSRRPREKDNDNDNGKDYDKDKKIASQFKVD